LNLAKPNKAQQRRIMLIQDIGCVACRVRYPDIAEPCDIHHPPPQTHDTAIGLCPWHHRGILKNDLGMWEMCQCFGPSMIHQRAAFRETFGTDQELLEMQNQMLAKTEEEGYAM